MATVFAYKALNQYTEKGFFDSVIDGSQPNAIIRSFSQVQTGTHTLLWEMKDVSVPVSAYNQFASTKDSMGLQTYMLQGNDDINGSQENDVLAGFGGDDFIQANGGDDYVNGNQGKDFINGNAGNDTLEGGKDDDWLEGGQGNDSVNGNMGNDLVRGNKGDDTLRGGQGNDNLEGGQGNDQLFGDLGDDVILGDLGNDTLTGGEGSDLFSFLLGFGMDVITDFQNGMDVLLFDSSLGVTDFSQLNISNAGGNAQITFASGDFIVLLGVNASQLDASDVAFA